MKCILVLLHMSISYKYLASSALNLRGQASGAQIALTDVCHLPHSLPRLFYLLMNMEYHNYRQLLQQKEQTEWQHVRFPDTAILPTSLVNMLVFLDLSLIC